MPYYQRPRKTTVAQVCKDSPTAISAEHEASTESGLPDNIEDIVESVYQEQMQQFLRHPPFTKSAQHQPFPNQKVTPAQQVNPNQAEIFPESESLAKVPLATRNLEDLNSWLHKLIIDINPALANQQNTVSKLKTKTTGDSNQFDPTILEQEKIVRTNVPVHQGEIFSQSIELDNQDNTAVTSNLFSSFLTNYRGYELDASAVQLPNERVFFAPNSSTSVDILITLPVDIAIGRYYGVVQACKAPRIRTFISFDVALE